MAKILTFLKLDNITVRSKLLLMYALCILLPILSINYIFWNKTSTYMHKNEMIYTDLAMERINTALKNAIQECVILSHTIYSDKGLSDSLEVKYHDNIEYVDAYNRYFEGFLSKYMPAYPQIGHIYIYTDNSTILNADNFFKIDEEVKNSPWYRVLNGDDRNSIMSFSYLSDNEGLIIKDRITFSILRNLDKFKGTDTLTKILKIDIKMNYITDIIKNEGLKGDVYLLNGQGDILYSSKEEYMRVQGASMLNYSALKNSGNTFQVTKELGDASYLRGFKLIGVFPKENLFAVVESSKIFIIFLTLLCLILTTTIGYRIFKSLTVRLGLLTDHMRNIKNENLKELDCEKGRDEIAFLIKEFNSMTRRTNRLIQNVYEAEIEQKNLELGRKQAELYSLQSQINPHFLFNALETIRMRSILKGEKETSEIITYLSKTFRRVLTFNNDFVTVKNELEFIEDFLKIQKYRFEEKLDYVITVDDKAMDWPIPKMSIQVFVENASVHGIEKKVGGGLIKLNIYTDNNYLYVQIEDTGIGMNKQKVDMLNAAAELKEAVGKSIGIGNVIKRLELFYGKDFEFFVDSKENEGTKVSLKLPSQGGNKDV